MHAADQMLVYAALAGPGSTFTARAISLHAQTAMWLIEQFLPVRFRISDMARLKRIDVSSRNST
jgi:RNA 3'-terminal phosphate cyclase